MSLLVYECQRADYAHEIREFEGVVRSLRNYYEGRKELALVIGNVHIGNVELDGIIVKEDAIIILELKDYSGKIVARMNGDWTCDGEVIRGGSNKTVFEQIQVNKRNLRGSIERNGYFTNVQANDIQGVVAFSKIKSLTNELDRNTRQWLHISDVANSGGAMHSIKARSWRNSKTGEVVDVLIPEEAIFNFIRKLHLDESCLVTKMSDVHLLPSDLYHEDKAHDGRDFSTATELAKAKEKIGELNKQIEEAKRDKTDQVGKMTVLVAKLQNALLLAQEREMDLLRQISERSAGVASISGKENSTKEGEVVSGGESSKPAMESVSPVEPPKASKPLVSLVRRSQHLKEWDVKNPDEDQLALIEKTLDKSMLIAGCAGSGKSVIALHKAMRICEAGGDVILIAFTKSLNRYMAAGKANNGLGKRFFYYWQWKDEGKPKADYVIVDEIQDFTRSEIEEFITAANKSYFFFGDTAQSIYDGIRPGTLTVEEVSDLTGLKILHLYNNYRLPKPVAQITQTYVGVDVNPYEEAVYQSKERERPRFLKYESVTKQADAIVGLIAKNKWRNVGILLPSNNAVCEMYRYLRERNLVCESKYSAEQNTSQASKDTLNFCTECPKLMTYHSAKGLQFETVILPMFIEAKSNSARKSLYVAMTRTYRNLYVLYTGQLGEPLSNVPTHLYTTRE